MQDREGEHFWVLQEGEMAHIRQDQEAGVRDGRGNIPVCSRLIASLLSPSTTRMGLSTALS